jgi:hypothetical protein
MVFDANLYGLCLKAQASSLIPFLSLRTKIAAASAWLPLLYDTAVMGLTAYKAFQNRSLGGYFRSQILQTILAEGMIYYR